jgi:hypothetical protein
MKEIENTFNSWHLTFAELLKELLIPLNINIFPECPMIGNPPPEDIMLLRHEQTAWTTEQFERLPDGIRHFKTTDILLKFKYTELVNEEAFIQARMYDYLYKRHQQLTDQEVQTFIVNAKKPRQKTREKWGYETTLCQGVYLSDNECLKKIPLISLNELARERHNAYFKLFCSHQVERESAFKLLENESFPFISEPLESLLSGLQLLRGEQEMRELTPKEVRDLGRKWGKRYLSTLSPEERLAGVPLEERLAGLTLPEILAHFKPAEIEAYLKTSKKPKTRRSRRSG